MDRATLARRWRTCGESLIAISPWPVEGERSRRRVLSPPKGNITVLRQAQDTVTPTRLSLSKGNITVLRQAQDTNTASSGHGYANAGEGQGAKVEGLASRSRSWPYSSSVSPSLARDTAAQCAVSAWAARLKAAYVSWLVVAADRASRARTISRPLCRPRSR